ncbi:DUF2625 domain-containing protein [Saccharopolyspora indica]|uniref:DUF2625 family protein n=1 Tax=Saccharopolyspora indica TaxID=1229659 RepID=UPI0022EA393C|nr:DUF2625 family protein [Saccharopolyspora indica]MDA3649078.1 DUF2625 family protein [Saccharopolyspora indica]
MRELTELTDVADPAWPEIERELAVSSVPAEVVPVDPGRGRATLLQLQVTARSYLGGFALNCGGLLLDHGWLRTFGSPAAGNQPELAGFAQVNDFPKAFDPEWRATALIIAHDVLGGVFAINGAAPQEHARPGSPGEVIYFVPASLSWEALGIGHADWLSWTLSGALDEFYAGERWPGWQDEVRAMTAAQGMSCFPPLWSAEARGWPEVIERKPVPMAEVIALARDTARQFDNTDPGFLGAV